MKRQLSQEEKDLCSKNVELMNEQEQQYEYQLESIGLLMEYGLDFNFRKEKEKLEEYLKQLKDISNEEIVEQDKKDIEYQIKSGELMLNRGLKFKYDRERLNLKGSIEKVKAELKEIKWRREVTLEQIENGVEIKEKEGDTSIYG